MSSSRFGHDYSIQQSSTQSVFQRRSVVKAPICHHTSVSTVDEQGHVHTQPLVTTSYLRVVNHAFLCWDIGARAVAPKVVPFSDNACARSSQVYQPDVVPFHDTCVVTRQETSCNTGLSLPVSTRATHYPVNHAYICMDVATSTIGPCLVSMRDDILPSTYEQRQQTYRVPSSTTHVANTPLAQSMEGVSANIGQKQPSCSRHDTTDTRFPSNTPAGSLGEGDCDQRCRHCGGLFWVGERLKRSAFEDEPEYNLCCEGGKIYMTPPVEPPEFIQQLLRNKHLMEHIRAYNQMFAMTSFGAKIDDTVNVGRGPYVFKVSGQIYHWIGSLCPEVGDPPRFLQLYFYDTQHEATNRIRNFGAHMDTEVSRDIINGLIHVLDECNGLVQLFRTARDMCVHDNIPPFRIRLYNKGGVRGYELPTSDSLGGIVFEDGPKSRTDFDVIIQARYGPPQRVNK